MFVINTTKVLHRDTGLCMTASNIITGETFLQIPFKGVQSVYQYLQELEEYISSPLRIAADFNIYSQRAFQIYYSGRADGAPVKQWINARKLLPANRVIYGTDQACELRLHRDGYLFSPNKGFSLGRGSYLVCIEVPLCSRIFSRRRH